MRFYIKTILMFFIFLFVVMNIIGVSAQDWWDGDWSNRKEIDIENVGGSPLLNYTAYIKVIKTNSMQSDYDDLRFVYNGDLLDHEIGYYNDTYCDCYVRISNFADTGISLYMYYNNPSVNGLDIHKEAWDDNAVRINHMEDTSEPVFDSTEYSNDILTLNVIFEQEGIISNGFYMSKNLSSYLNRTINIPFDDEMAFSTWIRTDYSSVYPIYIISRSWGWATTYYIYYLNNVLNLCIRDSGWEYHCIDYTFSPGEFNDSSWHMISGYLDADYMKLYFDGVELASDSGGFNIVHYSPPDIQCLHGYSYFSNAYEGYLDEAKVFKKSFDEGWHKQEYEIVINQTDVVEFGVEENNPETSYIFTLPVSNVGTDEATLRANLTITSGVCSVWFCWSPVSNQCFFETERETYNIAGIIEKDIKGITLSPDTKYYYNSYALCDDVLYTGGEMTFTTSSLSPLAPRNFSENLAELETNLTNYTNLLEILPRTYVDLLGNIFYAIIIASVYLALWIRQEDVTIPLLVGLALGCVGITALPPIFLNFAYILTMVSITGLIYMLIKGRNT